MSRQDIGIIRSAVNAAMLLQIFR